MTSFLLFFGGFVLGIATLLGYILRRMMQNDGWDDSNITNALRLLSHVTLHPTDFGVMYYRKYDDTLGKHVLGRRPFWYVNKDELSEVVRTRP
jgi:hypothetical protein